MRVAASMVRLLRTLDKIRRRPLAFLTDRSKLEANDRWLSSRFSDEYYGSVSRDWGHEDWESVPAEIRLLLAGLFERVQVPREGCDF